jgi:hypothetical protein
MGTSTPKTLRILFALSILVELVMLSFYKGLPNIYISVWIWFIAGLTTCVTAYLLIGKSSEIRQVNPVLQDRLIVWIVFTLSALFIGSKLQVIFSQIEISPENSDVIPAIQFYVRRLLAGETVYAPMPMGGWEVIPNYLPLSWLSFTFSEVARIDYRWTAFLVFILANFLWTLRVLKQEISLLEKVVKSCLPFLFLVPFVLKVPDVFGNVVELNIVGHYLLLSLALFSRNRYVLAGGILLCLLSRFSFTFWLPAFFIIYWAEYGFKAILQVGLAVLAGFVLIYIIPFVLNDQSNFLNGMKYYQYATLAEWEVKGWQQPGDKPFHLGRGHGFAVYFYDYISGSLEAKLNALKRAQVIASLIAAAGFIGFYFMQRKKGLNFSNYALIGLKFYMLIFYAFIQVPYTYLHLVPFFISIALIYQVAFSRSVTSA